MFGLCYARAQTEIVADIWPQFSLKPKEESSKPPASKPDANDGDADDPLLTTPLPRYNTMLAVLRNTLYMSVK